MKINEKWKIGDRVTTVCKEFSYRVIDLDGDEVILSNGCGEFGTHEEDDYYENVDAVIRYKDKQINSLKSFLHELVTPYLDSDRNFKKRFYILNNVSKWTVRDCFDTYNEALKYLESLKTDNSKYSILEYKDICDKGYTYCNDYRYETAYNAYNLLNDLGYIDTIEAISVNVVKWNRDGLPQWVKDLCNNETISFTNNNEIKFRTEDNDYVLSCGDFIVMDNKDKIIPIKFKYFVKNYKPISDEINLHKETPKEVFRVKKITGD